MSQTDIIKKIKNISKWYVYAKRKGPYYPYPLHVFNRGFCEGWKKNFKECYLRLHVNVFYGNGWVEVYYLQEDIDKLQKVVLAKTLHPKEHFAREMLSEYTRYARVLRQITRQLQQVNLSKPKLCFNVLRKLHQIYIDSTTSGAVTPWGGICLTNLLTEYLSKKTPQSLVPKYFSILSAPTKPSFVFQENGSLLKIAYKFQQGIDIKKDLKQHTQKFAWIPFDYNGPQIYTESYFMAQIQQILKQGNIKIKIQHQQNYLKNLKKQQHRLLKKLKIDVSYCRLFKDMQTFVWQKDFKKEIYTKVHLAIWQFLQKLSKERRVKVQNLVYLTSQEIEKFVLTNQLDQQEIKKRKQLCINITTPQNTQVFTGRLAKNLVNNIHQKTNTSFKVTVLERKEIRGQSASHGKARGTIKIILNPSEIDTMQAKKVLVTSMTTPIFVPTMRQAVAIITDEGGITCHAAIVSRELGIPCIIGAKIATKVLKDGDLVEVDADKGVVRILI